MRPAQDIRIRTPESDATGADLLHSYWSGSSSIAKCASRQARITCSSASCTPISASSCRRALRMASLERDAKGSRHTCFWGGTFHRFLSIPLLRPQLFQRRDLARQPALTAQGQLQHFFTGIVGARRHALAQCRDLRRSLRRNLRRNLRRSLRRFVLSRAGERRR